MIANLFAENPISGLDEQARIDPVSKCLVNVDLLHYLRHLGLYFQHNGRIAALANGAVYDHLLITPDAALGVDIHVGVLTFDTTSSPCELYLYEDCTVSANGSSQAPVNVNRNSSNSSSLQVYHAPTVVTTGTQLNYSMSSGDKQNGGAGEASFAEFILRRGSKYLLRLVNSSGGAAALLEYTMEWVEVPQPT